MPTFIQEIPELDICVRRPVISEIVQSLFEQTNIDASKLKIYQMGRTVAIPQLNSTLDESDNKERLSNDTRVEVSMDEDITNVTIAPILYGENISVFRDDALQVTMLPTMLPVKTTLNVRFICSSRAAAQNWQQAIRRRVSQRAFNPIHTVNYYYPIPKEYMYVLSKIYEMREKKAGYGDTFGQWLKTNFNHRYSVISNAAGKGTQFVIREQQTNVIGYYEFGEEVEKLEKENSAGSYAVEFNYTFHYERPENIILKFPVVIHNSIVPAEIRDDRQIEDQQPEQYYLTNSAAAFHSFAFGGGNNLPRHQKFNGWPLPYFDDWFPSFHQQYYENLFRVTTAVSVNEPRWVGNVGHIKPHDFPADVLEYMKRRPQAMSERREHLFNVSLHRWDDLFATRELKIDKTLKVTSPVDMNLRDMWHMNIDIAYDLSILSDAALEDLCKSPGVLDKWVESFDPNGPMSNLPKNPDGTYNPNDVRDAIADSNNDRDYANRKRKAHLKTVGLYSILARRAPN